MAEEDAKRERLVHGIVAHELVKAAAILDTGGTIERVEGQAKVIRSGDPVGVDGTPADDGGTRHEDVFIESMGDDYLVVVFEAREDFEPIKRKVDELFDELGISRD